MNIYDVSRLQEYLNQQNTIDFNRPNINEISGDITGGITSITPTTTFQDFYSPVYEPYNPEKDDEQVSYNELTGQQSFLDRITSGIQNVINQPGISSIIGAFNPLAGIITRGIGSFSPSFVGPRGSTGYGTDTIGGLFARSTNFAAFAQAMRDKKARELAAQRGSIKELQRQIDAGQFDGKDKDTGMKNRESRIGGQYSDKGGGGGKGGKDSSGAVGRDAGMGMGGKERG